MAEQLLTGLQLDLIQTHSPAGSEFTIVMIERPYDLIV